MTAQLDKHRILVADDESLVREMYLQVLSCDFPDCRVDLAVNGEEAIDAFREGRPAVLVMDIYMPIMNGDKAFQEIRKICEREGIEEPSVIFCTGFDPSDAIQSLVEKDGKHCLLRKPFNISDLTEALRDRIGSTAS